jgi:hypothetical protein
LALKETLFQRQDASQREVRVLIVAAVVSKRRSRWDDPSKVQQIAEDYDTIVKRYHPGRHTKGLWSN